MAKINDLRTITDGWSNLESHASFQEAKKRASEIVARESRKTYLRAKFSYERLHWTLAGKGSGWALRVEVFDKVKTIWRARSKQFSRLFVENNNLRRALAIYKKEVSRLSKGWMTANQRVLFLHNDLEAQRKLNFDAGVKIQELTKRLAAKEAENVILRVQRTDSAVFQAWKDNALKAAEKQLAAARIEIKILRSILD